MTAETEIQVDADNENQENSADSESPSTEMESGSADFFPADPATKQDKLGRILSMKVPVIVKIAQKKMTISEILKLRLGSVIQFDKDPYQNIDLMVNNSVVGTGQPVKVNENFGLKIVQIGNLADTIKSLGGNSES